MSIYEKLLNSKIKEIENEIRNMELNLRCCGNCLNFVHSNTIYNCKLKRHDLESIINPFRCCEHWDCDRLEYSDRNIDNTETVTYKD